MHCVIVPLPPSPFPSRLQAPCPPGFFCPSPIHFRPCPPGTASNVTGASDPGTCTVCALGQYCPSGSPAPVGCPSRAVLGCGCLECVTMCVCVCVLEARCTGMSMFVDDVYLCVCVSVRWADTVPVRLLLSRPRLPVPLPHRYLRQQRRGDELLRLHCMPLWVLVPPKHYQTGAGMLLPPLPQSM